MPGQSSAAQPCSVMSGQTPVAMSWSMARSTSTLTPCFSMIARLRSTNPWVWLRSGDRFSVQLITSARRSSKRHGRAGLGSLIGRDSLVSWAAGAVWHGRKPPVACDGTFPPLESRGCYSSSASPAQSGLCRDVCQTGKSATLRAIVISRISPDHAGFLRDQTFVVVAGRNDDCRLWASPDGGDRALGAPRQGQKAP